MSYDPEARRDTPLALKLKARIRAHGPLTVQDYMQACLQDEEHGYYRTRSAIGSRGDFITAPEISQIFGELLGLWSVVVWQQMGQPAKLRLIELGPGRGTMLRDALRACRASPAFTAAIEVVLVESNPALAAEQRRALAAVTALLRWLPSLDTLEPGTPAIVLGNEFLDALPVQQYVVVGNRPHVRHVALDRDGRLIFTVAPSPAPATPALEAAATAPDGAVIEVCDWQAHLAPLARLIAAAPAAALFIDYGHVASAPGDTLQALRHHAYEHPLTSPGEADLTTHVDFAAVARALHPTATISGPITQGEFLGSLGIAERASRLMSANPALAPTIEAGVFRLMSPTGMGSRFKVLGLSSPHLSPLPALPALDSTGQTRFL